MEFNDLKRIPHSKEYIEEDVGCEWYNTQQQKTRERIGEIEIISRDDEPLLFRFIGERTYEKFTVDDRKVEKKIKERLQQKMKTVAYITFQNENLYAFFVTILFFPNGNEFASLGTLPVYLTEQQVKLLQNNHILDENLSFIKNPSLKNKGSEFFFFTKRYNEVDELEFVFYIPNNEKWKRLYIQIATNRDVFSEAYMKLRNTTFQDGTVPPFVPEENKRPVLQLEGGTIVFRTEREYISKKVADELQGESQYFDILDQYADFEGETLLEQARAFGSIPIQEIVDIDGQYFIRFRNSADTKKVANVPLIAYNKSPKYLENRQLSYADWIEAESRESKEKKVREDADVTIRVKEIREDGILIDPVGQQNENGIAMGSYLYFNIQGNHTQMERRREAKYRLRNGESEMPTLALILNGQTNFVENLEGARAVFSLPSYIEKKVFPKNPPTKVQKEAIQIALNTPDIAIIQGPPGTGKTTVIQAIIECLNEIADKENGGGQVLLTSYQHDAVETVADRVDVNGMPTMKFGVRHGERRRSFSMKTLEWCNTLSEEIKKKHIEMETIESLQKSYKAYESVPTERNEEFFLKTAEQLLLAEISLKEHSGILSEISKELEKFTTKGEDFAEDTINLVRSIRVTRKSFDDDGLSVLVALSEKISNKNFSTEVKDVKRRLDTIWRHVVARATGIEKDELVELLEIRRFLLKKMVPIPSYQSTYPKKEVLMIYNRVRESLFSPEDKEKKVILDFLFDVQYHPENVERALKNHTFIYASTIQQTKGKDVAKAKNNRWVYDTVIVDEAARARPDDLLIPLVQAKRRIILVGDHRQLPHMYDDEVIEKMRESLQESGESFDKKSLDETLFERLMHIGQSLEQKDGIKRVISLDSQYRMHPMLGEFVNENFYKVFNEMESFRSPLPEENFVQDLYPSPACWIDVPVQGNERSIRKHGSRIRQAEIDVIVTEVGKFLDYDTENELSCGIITFYSAQVTAIKEALEEKFIDHSAYINAMQKEKIRIGSVDAFQGKEFDFIFLSTVRIPMKKENMIAQGLDDEPEEMEEERVKTEAKLAMQTFGFTTDRQRLCVATSRQKKVLVTVGCAELYNGLLAEKYVPQMKKFYEIAKKIESERGEQNEQ